MKTKQIKINSRVAYAHYNYCTGEIINSLGIIVEISKGMIRIKRDNSPFPPIWVYASSKSVIYLD